MKQKILLMFVVLGLAACGGVPITKEDLRKAEFGTPPTKELAISTVRKHLTESLIDPTSLQLRCADPRKGWVRPAPFESATLGYVVLCGVNAKNRFGGYTGETPYVFLINTETKSYFSRTGLRHDQPIQRGDEFDYVE